MAALAASLERLSHGQAAGLTPPPAVGAPSTAPHTGWWQLHHGIVSGLYMAMILPVWLNRGAPLPSWAHTGVMLAIILPAAVASTLRLHLVFIARIQPTHLAAARHRAGWWVHAADRLMALGLVAAAVGALIQGRVWFAALFFTVAASSTIASLFIEPATTAATFGAEG